MHCKNCITAGHRHYTFYFHIDTEPMACNNNKIQINSMSWPAINKKCKNARLLLRQWKIMFSIKRFDTLQVEGQKMSVITTLMQIMGIARPPTI